MIFDFVVLKVDGVINVSCEYCNHSLKINKIDVDSGGAETDARPPRYRLKIRTYEVEDVDERAAQPQSRVSTYDYCMMD